MEDEHATSLELGRPTFDLSNTRVPVLDRRRKFADLKGCAHPLVFANGHAAPKDERLRSSADAAEERADDNVTRRGVGQRFRPDFASAWRRDPERMDKHEIVPAFSSFMRTSDFKLRNWSIYNLV
jgi:hypothetical protein